jgi:hypothetical protein
VATENLRSDLGLDRSQFAFLLGMVVVGLAYVVFLGLIWR